MIRLLLIPLFAAFVVLAVVVATFAIIGLLRTLMPTAATATGPGRDPMPDILRNVAYGLLLILLFGVALGWLGA
jgi:hypothetical protein